MNRETRDLLIESGKREFLEKGYMKASLRKICSDVGVTTGAVYFLFEDKEDLFAAIVEPPFKELIIMVSEHFANDFELVSAQDWTGELEDDSHMEMAERILHHLYSHYDEFMILLTKAQGSRFENCIDELIELTEKKYHLMAKEILRRFDGYKINEYMCHWHIHMCVDAFTHLLLHEPNEQKAKKHIGLIINFIVKSAMSMIIAKR